jgi:hypothetical protein
MSRNEEIRLDKKNIVLVEGSDDCYFFEYFFKFLSLTSFQLIGCGGKDYLKRNAIAIRLQPNYTDCSNLIIVQDNDINPSGRFSKICSDLQEARIESIPSAPYQFAGSNPAISVVLLPNIGVPGDLERLILDTLEGKPIIECSRDFISCIQSIDNYQYPKESKLAKAELQTIMSVIDKEPRRTIGDAAQNGAWDFSHPKFNHLKEFFSSIEGS